MFNYAVFWSNSEFHRVSILDVLNENNVKVYYSAYDNLSPWLLKRLYQLHFSKKINRYFKIPFKNIWNNKFFNDDFENNNPICFIFTIAYIKLASSGYFEYLKQHYPGCKLVMYFRDTVESYKKTHERFNVAYIKKTFDLVFTYNQIDAQAYGIRYYPYVASKVNIFPPQIIKNSDIFFIGAAKDRLDMIHSAYEYFVKNGLSCDFYVTGVDESKQKHKSGITYNKKLKYSEVLQHIKQTKCILEITQKGAKGFTFRTTEALMYDKMLITDTSIIKESKLYNPLYVIVFKKIKDIDICKIKQNMDRVSFNYQNEYSPLRLLETIEQQFN